MKCRWKNVELKFQLQWQNKVWTVVKVLEYKTHSIEYKTFGSDIELFIKYAGKVW